MSGYNGWKDWDPRTHTVETGKKPSKYKAQKTIVDDITFHSKKEASRYQALLARGAAGEIEDLELQPRFPLKAQLTTGTVMGGARALAGNYPVVGHYVADFAYYDTTAGKRVVEDCKGFRTPLYRWKKKHFEQQYGISILET